MTGMGNECFYVSSYWWPDRRRIWNVSVGGEQAGSIVLSDDIGLDDAFLLASWCFLDNQEPGHGLDPSTWEVGKVEPWAWMDVLIE